MPQYIGSRRRVCSSRRSGAGVRLVLGCCLGMFAGDAGMSTRPLRAADEAAAPAPAADKPAAESPRRVASNIGSTAKPPLETGVTPVDQARREIDACLKRYASVDDYTCTFLKRERINGRLSSQAMIYMKMRVDPKSIYFKFARPNAGREAIFVPGRYDDKIVAHDVGLGKLFAGTMYLDPFGTRAMESNRHPITEAGIGAMLDKLAKHWAYELTPQESVVTFHPLASIGPRACLMIETEHPRRDPKFLFHKVKLYIDREHGLPIHIEAYDWPRRPGLAPELVEEYSYVDLKLNVGLTDLDFDPSNKSYSFGRF